MTSDCCTDLYASITCAPNVDGTDVCCLPDGDGCISADVCCSGICAPSAHLRLGRWRNEPYGSHPGTRGRHQKEGHAQNPNGATQTGCDGRPNATLDRILALGFCEQSALASPQPCG